MMFNVRFIFILIFIEFSSHHNIFININYYKYNLIFCYYVCDTDNESLWQVEVIGYIMI